MFLRFKTNASFLLPFFVFFPKLISTVTPSTQSPLSSTTGAHHQETALKTPSHQEGPPHLPKVGLHRSHYHCLTLANSATTSLFGISPSLFGYLSLSLFTSLLLLLSLSPCFYHSCSFCFSLSLFAILKIWNF